MTQKQLYEACVQLAPDFRIGIEFTTLPTVSRVLAWHGRKRGDMNERSMGIIFPEGSDFEPKLTLLLQQAWAELSRQ